MSRPFLFPLHAVLLAALIPALLGTAFAVFIAPPMIFGWFLVMAEFY